MLECADGEMQMPNEGSVPNEGNVLRRRGVNTRQGLAVQTTRLPLKEGLARQNITLVPKPNLMCFH